MQRLCSVLRNKLIRHLRSLTYGNFDCLTKISELLCGCWFLTPFAIFCERVISSSSKGCCKVTIMYHNVTFWVTNAGVFSTNGQGIRKLHAYLNKRILEKWCMG